MLPLNPVICGFAPGFLRFCAVSSDRVAPLNERRLFTARLCEWKQVVELIGIYNKLLR